MGAYRLILAILVALSHMGVSVYSYNPGVFAVISFFVISGFVTTALIRRNYPNKQGIISFYADRALRIYPQFLFYFLASIATIYTFLPNSIYARALNPENIVLSLAIFPLNFWMFGITQPDILPPAWSLGLELFFYSLIPFLLVLKIRGLCLTLSILVFIAACLGYLHTDFWGYRLLPGVLFIFLCGSYLYDNSRRQQIVIWATSLFAFATFSLIFLGIIPRAPFNTEVTAGIAFAIPAVRWLSSLSYSKMDEFLGNISYGVFLNHFIYIYLAQTLGHFELTATSATTILLLSILTSLFSYRLVERPILKMRHIIRQRNRVANAETQSS